MERSAQSLLHDFSTEHPVIHILRDSKGVQEHIQNLAEGKVAELLKSSRAVFKNCSNYEFYNSSESCYIPGNGTNTNSFLSLKKVERQFLRFLSLICSEDKTLTASAHPLLAVSPEARKFTYAVSVQCNAVPRKQRDIELIEFGSDALELSVQITKGSQATDACVKTDNYSYSSTTEDISDSYTRLRRNTIVPIIYNVGLPQKSHLETKEKSAYADMVHHGLRLVPEYLSVDLRMSDIFILGLAQRKGPTKLIGHYERFEETTGGDSWDEEFWLDVSKRGQRLGCDILRFVSQAQNGGDSFAPMQLAARLRNVHRCTLPVCAYNYGQLGKPSLCFNEILSPVTFDISGAYQSQNNNRPLVTAKEATQALFSSFILYPMRYYVVGASSSYSLSPAMHNAAFDACGLQHKYTICETSKLDDFCRLAKDPYFGGASIALPFKVEIISSVHRLSTHAEAIGAVNTVIPIRQLDNEDNIPGIAELFKERNRAGPVKALYGENTDWIGIRAAVQRGLSPANAIRPSTSALVIGAGGMARAAVYALLKLGIKNIAILNRTRQNGEKLIDHFTSLWNEQSRFDNSPKNSNGKTTFKLMCSREEPYPTEFRPPNVVVSCIPTHRIGDRPAPELTLPEHWLASPTGGVVLEVAYKNVNTPLLDQIRSMNHRGWIPMDGLDLLPEQGFAQFEFFTGRRAPRRLMREEVLRAYKNEAGHSDPDLLQSRLEKIDLQET